MISRATQPACYTVELRNAAPLLLTCLLTTYLLTYSLTEVVLSENEIEANGAVGVRLSEGADPLLERNTVQSSGPEPDPFPNPNPNPTPLPLTRCGGAARRVCSLRAAPGARPLELTLTLTLLLP